MYQTLPVLSLIPVISNPNNLQLRYSLNITLVLYLNCFVFNKSSFGGNCSHVKEQSVPCGFINFLYKLNIYLVTYFVIIYFFSYFEMSKLYYFSQ